MSNNETVVNDIEEKKVAPSPDSPDDEFLPLANVSGGKDEPPANSTSETKPGDQPAAPAPTEPVINAEGEKPEVVAPVATPAVTEPVKDDDDDVSVLAQGLKNLSTEYKRLDNETSVEYARRLEIIRLRKKGQEKKADELLGPTPQPGPTGVQSIVAPAEDDIDPAEVEQFEKIAKKAGYVKQSEADAVSYNRELQSVFKTWSESNPEFDETHDPDGILWGLLKEQFKSGIYNNWPKNPQDLAKTLNLIKKDILGIQPTSNLSSVVAKQEKIKVASHAGTSPGGNSSSPEDKTTSTKKALLSRGLVGFTDAEIEELAKE